MLPGYLKGLFGDVASIYWVVSSQHFDGTKFPQNMGSQLPSDMTSCPTLLNLKIV